MCVGTQSLLWGGPDLLDLMDRPGEHCRRGGSPGKRTCILTKQAHVQGFLASSHRPGLPELPSWELGIPLSTPWHIHLPPPLVICLQCRIPGFNPWVRKIPLGEGNGYPFQYSFLENSMNRGAWQAIVHGVAKSWTWLGDFHTHNHSDDKLRRLVLIFTPFYYREVVFLDAAPPTAAPEHLHGPRKKCKLSVPFHPRPIHWSVLWMCFSNLCFNKPSSRFWCTYILENCGHRETKIQILSNLLRVTQRLNGRRIQSQVVWHRVPTLNFCAESKILSPTVDWIVSSPNSCIEILTPNVTISGESIFSV